MGAVRFLQGNEAILEGALAAGARFYAGYPITPSSEIAEGAARKLPPLGGVFLQMEDELASMAAVIGASLAGVKAFTATSGPGFSLMQENLGLSMMAEVPCVVIDVQRPGPSLGLATRPAQGDVMQARWGTHGDHGIIVLCPSSVQECFELTVKAFNLSERFRNPVILLADEGIGHLRERVQIPDQVEAWERRWPRCAPDQYLPYRPDEDGVPPLAAYGSEYMFHTTGSMHGESGFSSEDPENAGGLIKRLSDKINNFRHEISFTSAHHTEGAELLLISYGASARSAQEATIMARARGVKVGFLNLNTLWPFPEEAVCSLSSSAQAVAVVEMNLGQLVGEVRRVVPDATPVHPICKSNGREITPDEVLEEVSRWF